MKPRIVRDIRIYADDWTPNSLCRPCGNFVDYYQPKFDQKQYANRFACKLRELEFVIDGFNHVMIFFCTGITHRKKTISCDGEHFWKRDITFGLEPNVWNNRDKQSQIETYIDYLAEIVSFAGIPGQSGIIQSAVSMLKQHGRSLKMKAYSKDLKSYAVTVSFQIDPVSNNKSVAFLEYTDKKSGQIYAGKFLDLDCDNDIYHLCGSMTIKDEIIEFKPTKTWLGDSIRAAYGNRLRISLTELGLVKQQ